MRVWKSRRLVPLLAIVLAVGVVSAVVLLEQRQPAVPVSGVLTGHCNPTAPTPTSVILGGNGEVTFSCNSNAPDINPAFTATATVLATPIITGFVAPYNTTRLYIFDADGFPNTGGCSGRAGPAQKIEAGVRESIPAGGWNYCAEYVLVDLNGLPQFTVTWNL